MHYSPTETLLARARHAAPLPAHVGQTGPTHIDEFCEAVTVVAPAGITTTPRHPASGAGPSEHRMFLGSEGILGIITSAWLRVLPRPRARTGATFYFSADPRAEQEGRSVEEQEDAFVSLGEAESEAVTDAAFLRGARAVRSVVQSGLLPSNLRLIDGPEMLRMSGDHVGTSEGRHAALIIGFEASAGDASKESVSSARARVEAEMREAGLLLRKAGALESGAKKMEASTSKEDSASGKWGKRLVESDSCYCRRRACGDGVCVCACCGRLRWLLSSLLCSRDKKAKLNTQTHKHLLPAIVASCLEATSSPHSSAAALSSTRLRRQ